MMMFDEMGFCGELDMLSAPFVEGDGATRQAEPEAAVEDDYSDEEIDIDELERRMWRDKMRLKRLKEQCKSKGVDAAKQRQSQEQARRKKMSCMLGFASKDAEKRTQYAKSRWQKEKCTQYAKSRWQKEKRTQFCVLR